MMRGIIGGATKPGQEFAVLTGAKMGLERSRLGKGKVSRLAFLGGLKLNVLCVASLELTHRTPNPFSVTLIIVLIISCRSVFSG